MQTTHFVATVEVATRVEQPVEPSSSLADYQPVIGRSARGWVEVRLRISASNLAHACTTAAAMARVATGAEALACQVMTEQEYDARHFAVQGRHAGDLHPAVPRQPTAAERARVEEPLR